MKETKPLLKNRIGLLKISDYLYQEHPEEIAEILAMIKFLPCHIEHIVHLGCFNIAGYSHYFDLVEIDEMTPSHV